MKLLAEAIDNTELRLAMLYKQPSNDWKLEKEKLHFVAHRTPNALSKTPASSHNQGRMRESGGCFNHGLQTLQGRWPALMASYRALNGCRFAGEILSAHLQSALWNGSRMAEATYGTLTSGGLSALCSLQPTRPLAASKAATARFFRVLINGPEFMHSQLRQSFTSRARTWGRGRCRSRDS